MSKGIPPTHTHTYSVLLFISRISSIALHHCAPISSGFCTTGLQTLVSRAALQFCPAMYNTEKRRSTVSSLMSCNLGQRQWPKSPISLYSHHTRTNTHIHHICTHTYTPKAHTSLAASLAQY